MAVMWKYAKNGAVVDTNHIFSVQLSGAKGETVWLKGESKGSA